MEYVSISDMDFLYRYIGNIGSAAEPPTSRNSQQRTAIWLWQFIIKSWRHWPVCGNAPGTGEFPAQMASNVENVSIWWRHHTQYTWHEKERWLFGEMVHHIWFMDLMVAEGLSAFNTGLVFSFRKVNLQIRVATNQVFSRDTQNIQVNSGI